MLDSQLGAAGRICEIRLIRLNLRSGLRLRSDLIDVLVGLNQPGGYAATGVFYVEEVGLGETF